MDGIARALLAAAFRLAVEAVPAESKGGLDIRAPVSRPASGLAALVRGPTIRPGAQIIVDASGRMRTLELDELAPLRLRLSIPF